MSHDYEKLMIEVWTKAPSNPASDASRDLAAKLVKESHDYLHQHPTSARKRRDAAGYILIRGSST